MGISISSCASVATVAKSISIDSGAVPPEMAKENFVLIGVLQA